MYPLLALSVSFHSLSSFFFSFFLRCVIISAYLHENGSVLINVPVNFVNCLSSYSLAIFLDL